MKLLLHVCCGPCALEPYRILKNSGYDISLYYSNDNIFPESEFERRLYTLNKWAEDNDIDVIYDKYNHILWQNAVVGRCEDCYKLRLEKSANFAVSNGYTHLSTSLAVSPYQQTKVIENTLINVCKEYNLKPVFIDFRPYYKEATKRSIELGMYRQKYCGCEYSLKERKEQVKQKQENIKKQKSIQEASKLKKAKIKAKQDRKKELLQNYKSNH
ncbi:MAG: epoxyqueuosine reductase QueH [Coriobacteriia bacterium]|nr:epoxyqueuosine reductase QueH [Coriobacteriia bacterium]